MKTISRSSDWYFIKKEVFLSPWYVYLPMTDEIVDLKDHFRTELDLMMVMEGSYVNF